MTAAAHDGDESRSPGFLRSLAEEVRALDPRDAARGVARGFHDNNLLTYASAISFQVFFALIPLLLFAIAVLGTIGLEQVWREDIAPKVAESVSGAAFVLIDDTVTQILRDRHLFWITAGAALALWEVSGATRAVIGALNRIYEIEEERSTVRRFAVSFVLSAALAVIIIAAVLVAQLGGPVVDEVLGRGWLTGAITFVVSWGLAVALLVLAVGLTVRYAPAERRPMRWVSFGTLLVIAGWIGWSLLFGWYLTSVARYGSVFGALAAVIVTLQYLYVSAVVFLGGVQIDALARKRAESGGGGGRRGESGAPLLAGGR